MAWFATFTLQGNAVADKSTLKFELNSADYAEADADAGTLLTYLGLITDAEISRLVLSEEQMVSGVRPAHAVNVFDEAVVTTYLDAATNKLHTIRVPAPTAALFLADGQTVNVANADLINWVAQLAAVAVVSDGEAIDTSVNNGMVEGYRRSKARRMK